MHCQGGALPHYKSFMVFLLSHTIGRALGSASFKSSDLLAIMAMKLARKVQKLEHYGNCPEQALRVASEVAMAVDARCKELKRAVIERTTTHHAIRQSSTASRGFEANLRPVLKISRLIFFTGP